MALNKRGLGKGLDSMIPRKSSVSRSNAGINNSGADQNQNNVSRETLKGVSGGLNSENHDGQMNIKPDSTDKIINGYTEEKSINQKSDSSLDSDVSRETSDRIEQADLDENKEVKIVKITKVEPNRNQPRKVFNEDALQELADSIKQYGILQPLLVYDRDSYYEIIAGERRWRAAKLAGLKEIPVWIKKYSDQEIIEISLIENIQRENLNPIEEAKAYKRLTDEFGLKQDELAESVSKSRTAVTNSMRLLKLCDEVQQMVIDEMISAGHARTLIPIEDKELQIAIATRIFDEKLSVREAEKIVKGITTPKQVKVSSPAQTGSQAEDAVFESLEERMKGILGAKVSIQRKKNNKGKIEIEYYSKEELERIIDLFNSIK